MASHHPAPVGEAVRKLVRGRHQQEPRGFGPVRADDHGLGPLKDFSVGRVEVLDPGHPAPGIGLDLSGVGERPNFAAAGGERFGDRRYEGARLGLHFAAEGLAEAARDAGPAAAVRFGKDTHRGRKRGPAELFRGPLEQDPGGLDWNRRERIRPAPRRIEGARAGKSGDADLPLDPRIVGLQVGVGDGPIGHRASGQRALAASLDEVDLVEPPEIPGVVDRSAADDAPIRHRVLRLRLLLVGHSVGVRRAGEVVGQRGEPTGGEFVVVKVRLVEERPLLERDHGEPGGRQLPDDDTARRPDPDHDEVHFTRGGHSSRTAVATRTGRRIRSASSPLCRNSRRRMGWRAGR